MSKADINTIVKTPTSWIAPDTQVGNRTFYVSASTNLRDQQSRAIVQPLSGFNATVIQAANNVGVRFNIPPDPHFVKSLTLLLTIANSDGANAAGISVLNILNNIHFRAGSVEFCTPKTGVMLYQELITYYDASEAARILTPAGISPTTFLTNASIPSLGNTTFEVRIPNPFVETQMPTFLDKTPLSVTIDLTGGANIINSGAATAATLTLTSLVLLVDGIKLHPQVFDVVKAKAETTVHTFRFLDSIQATLPSNSVTAAKFFRQVMNQTGLCSHLWLIFQDSTANTVGDAKYKSNQVSALDILDSGARSLFGCDVGIGQPDALVRGSWSIGVVKSTSVQTVFNYCLAFNSDVYETLKTGSSFGYRTLVPTDQISIQPLSTLATMVVTVLFKLYALVEIDPSTGKVTQQLA